MNAWQIFKSYFSLESKSSGMMHPGYSGNGLTSRSWAESLLSQLGIYSGTRVDYAKEIGDLSLSSLLMAAVNWFGTTMPEATLIIQEPVKDKWEKVLDHPVTRLWEQPNPYYTGEQFALAIAFSWILDGNVYLQKVRNRAGQVVELWYLPHFLTEPQFDPRSTEVFISHYLYQVNGVDYHLPVEDVLHIRRGLDPANPRKGLNMIKPIMREVYSDNEASNYSATMFKNLGIPGLIIAPGADAVSIETGDRKQMRESFEREYSGDGKGKVMIASRKVDVHQLSFDPSQLVPTEARYIAEERWAAITGIPAIVLQFGAGLRRSTFANYEQAVRQAYHSFLIPTMRQIGPQITQQLVREVSETARARFDTSEMRVLQEDRESLSKRITEEWKADLLTREEAKLHLGRATTPDDLIYYSQFKAKFVRAPIGSNVGDDDADKPKDDKKALPEPLQEKAAKKSDEQAASDWWDNFADSEAQGLLEAEIIEAEDV